jgi:hypothetical protein
MTFCFGSGSFIRLKVKELLEEIEKQISKNDISQPTHIQTPTISINFLIQTDDNIRTQNSIPHCTQVQ